MTCGALLCVTQDFIHRGVAVEDVADAVFAHGSHAELAGFFLDDEGGLAGVDEVADGVGDAEVFEDAFAAFVTGVVAIGATASVEEVAVADIGAGEVEAAQKVVVGGVGGFAVGADGTGEALA